MTGWLTPAEFRAWAHDRRGAPLDDPPSDTLLEQLIDACQEQIRTYLRRDYAGADPAPQQRTFWPTSSTGTLLLLGVASTVTRVELDGELLPADDWRAVPTGTRGGLVLRRRRGTWTPGEPVDVVATFDAGDPPPAVVEALARATTRSLDRAAAIETPGGELGGELISASVAVRWRDPDVAKLCEPHCADWGR